MFLFFNLLMWYITHNDLWILKSPDKPNFIMVYDLFNALLDWLGSILLRIFVPIFISDTDQ